MWNEIKVTYYFDEGKLLVGLTPDQPTKSTGEVMALLKTVERLVVTFFTVDGVRAKAIFAKCSVGEVDEGTVRDQLIVSFRVGAVDEWVKELPCEAVSGKRVSWNEPSEELVEELSFGLSGGRNVRFRLVREIKGSKNVALVMVAERSVERPDHTKVVNVDFAAKRREKGGEK